MGWIPSFVAVAEHKSFTRAARALGVSTSAVSQAVARLERELGVALLVRTTRSVNLTDAGRTLLASASPALTSVASTLANLADGADRPSGVLRLNVPRLACRVALGPVLGAYVRAHPRMQVEVTVDDRNVDIVEQGYDAGVRLRESLEQDMACVRLSPPIRFVVVASKRYLAEHGTPRHPRELVKHSCIAWQSPTTLSRYRWEFELSGRTLEVAVNGPIATNDADLLVTCALDHLGLAYVAEHEAASELASGRLATVLDAYCPEVPGLFLYYPRAAQRIPKLSAFVECAQKLLQRPKLRPRASARSR